MVEDAAYDPVHAKKQATGQEHAAMVSHTVKANTAGARGERGGELMEGSFAGAGVDGKSPVSDPPWAPPEVVQMACR